jgi:hypothetical protein
MWQKGKAYRQDSAAATGGGTAMLLKLEDRVVLCQQPAGGKFTCTLASETQVSSFDTVRSSLLSHLATSQLTARDATIAGRSVRCFSVPEPEKLELCATPEGVFARISAPEGTFELLSLEDEVDDSVFIPPATPGAG